MALQEERMNLSSSVRKLCSPTHVAADCGIPIHVAFANSHTHTLQKLGASPWAEFLWAELLWAFFL